MIKVGIICALAAAVFIVPSGCKTRSADDKREPAPMGSSSMDRTHSPRMPEDPGTAVLLRGRTQPAQLPGSDPMYEVVARDLPGHASEYFITSVWTGRSIDVAWFPAELRINSIESLVEAIEALPADIEVYAGNPSQSPITGATLRGLTVTEIDQIKHQLVLRPPLAQ